MKWILVCMLTLLTVGLSQSASAEDSIQSLLVHPEVLFRHQEQLALSEEQTEQIRSAVEEAREESQELQQQGKEQIGKLAETLSADQVDETAALKQLDQLIAIESEQKRVHFKVMIQIRNLLTSEQLKVAKELQSSARNMAETEQRLKAKLQRIEAAVQKKVQSGEQPHEIVGLMQKLPELMKAGRVQEAEALLDQVIGMLGMEKQTGKAAEIPAELAAKIKRLQQKAQKMAQNREDLNEMNELFGKVGPLIEAGKIEEASQLIDDALGTPEAQDTTK